MIGFPPLERGTLVRRYKRFLADVELASGDQVTAHCPNTGAMTGLVDPGLPVWLLASNNPKRKLPWTLELVETASGLVCVHSARANAVVGSALKDGLLPTSGAVDRIRAEVRYGTGSRADFVVDTAGLSVTVEVKAVTLHVGDGLGLFPDTVSHRARKHAHELIEVVSRGGRAAMVFCSLHGGVERIEPAAEIDPEYTKALTAAVAAGVEVYGVGVSISPDGIALSGLIPVTVPCKKAPSHKTSIKSTL